MPFRSAALAPVVALAVALALLAGACTGGGSKSSASRATTTVPAATGLTSPPPTPAPSSTTSTTGRPRTTTTEVLDIVGGGARISGTVTGPDGAVSGATVHVERLVGSQEATQDVTTGGGLFNLASVRGGSYRVRAWRQPDLVQLEPEVFFLAADDTKTLDLRLVKVSDLSVQATVDPPPPPQDPFTIVVFVYAGSVSSQGTIQAIPRASVAVQLLPGVGLALVGVNGGTTDTAGHVAFQARCVTPGPAGADVLIGTIRLPLTLPSCPTP